MLRRIFQESPRYHSKSCQFTNAVALMLFSERTNFWGLAPVPGIRMLAELVAGSGTRRARSDHYAAVSRVNRGLVRAAVIVFNLGIGAVERADLKHMVAANLRQVVLHRVKVLVVLVGSDIPNRLAGAVRLQAAPTRLGQCSLLFQRGRPRSGESGIDLRHQAGI